MQLRILPLDQSPPSRTLSPLESLGIHSPPSSGGSSFLTESEAIDVETVESNPSLGGVPKLRGEYKQKECVREKPWMRVAMYMTATGAKVSRIAEQCQVSEASVSSLFRQQWFRQGVADLIHQEMSDDVGGLLKACAVESILVIRDLATNSPSDAVKLKAAQDLLDRHRGKATNFVQHLHGKTSDDPAKELESLKADLAELQNGKECQESN